MHPSDKRRIQHKKQALMDPNELREYLNEKNYFYSNLKELSYKQKKLREKDKDFRESYLKSFIFRSEFQSNTLALFKKQTHSLNSNTKPEIIKSKEVL
jgi:hypothetical protein